MDGKTITLEVKHLAEEAAHIWSEVGIFEWKQENTLSTKETIKKRRKKERKQALDQETIRNFLLFLIILLVKSLFSFFSFFSYFLAFFEKFSPLADLRTESITVHISEGPTWGGRRSAPKKGGEAKGHGPRGRNSGIYI